MALDARRHLLEIYHTAVQAVSGLDCVCARLTREPPTGPVYVMAIGKAACAMMRGAHEALGRQIADAFVVTRRGAAEPLPWPVIEAGHPVPDEASLEAGRLLDEFIARLPARAGVLVLLSGGGSALLEQLPPGMGLDDLRELNRWLLGSGLDIHAMNAIRQRLSRVKGGRLAQRLYPRDITVLAVSDVPGDDPRSIASGPFTAALAHPWPARHSSDRETNPTGVFDDQHLPPFVRALLAHATPLPAPDDPSFERVRYEIVASNEEARKASRAAARQLGYEARAYEEILEDDALTVGERLARHLLESPPGTVHVWGGETTVVLPPVPGRGGRCQSLALSAAIVLAGHTQAFLLAAGTDGSDGPGEDAGALIDGGTISRGEAQGFKAQQALTGADAGNFLEASGDLVHTGPTGTNVMDLVMGLRL